MVFAIVMFIMAFMAVRFSLITFLVELILAITASVIVAISIMNIKSLISAVLTSASKRLFKDDSKNIDDIMIPVVILSKENEIMAANALFKENVCGNEDPLGDSITKYYSWFVFNSDSLRADWSKKHRGAKSAPMWLGPGGKKQDNWCQYEWSDFYVSGGQLTEYACMPSKLGQYNSYYTEPWP